MEFRELSDEEWGLIEPLLPSKTKTGRPRADDRSIKRHTHNRMQMDGHTTQIWTLLHSIQKTQRLANTRHMDTHTQNLNNQRIHNRQSIERVSVDSTTIEAKKGEHS